MPEETDVPELNVKLEAFDTYTQVLCQILLEGVNLVYA